MKKRDLPSLAMLELPGFFSAPQLEIPVPKRTDGRRAARLVSETKRRLEALRVREVLMENGFPYRDRFREFRVPENREVVRALGEQLLDAAGGLEGGEAALLCADSLSGCAAPLLETFSARFRQVLLIAPGKGEGLRRWLWETRGIAAVVDPGPSLLARCDTAAFFRSPPYPVALKASCVMLDAAKKPLENVSGGRPVGADDVVLPEAFRRELPDRYDPVSAAALALTCGALTPEKLRHPR